MFTLVRPYCSHRPAAGPLLKMAGRPQSRCTAHRAVATIGGLINESYASSTTQATA
jgi:hypothetical protein